MCDLQKIFEKRRSVYKLNNNIPISEYELEKCIKEAIKHVPSAFNSQSSRVVLLIGDKNIVFWKDIVLKSLQKIVPENKFEYTKQRILSFSEGYGTVLFFEDMDIIENLENKFPEYRDNFIIWANQTSAMLQYMIWTLFTDKNIGASLQHYNPLIDDKIKQFFNIDKSWKLIAQMPFGCVAKTPENKEFSSVDDRLKVFK